MGAGIPATANYIIMVTVAASALVPFVFVFVFSPSLLLVAPSLTATLIGVAMVVPVLLRRVKDRRAAPLRTALTP